MTRRYEIGLAGNDPQESDVSKAGQTVRSFGKDLKTLIKHPVYVFAVLGSAVYTGILAWHSLPYLPRGLPCSVSDRLLAY